MDELIYLLGIDDDYGCLLSSSFSFPSVYNDGWSCLFTRDILMMVMMDECITWDR